MESHLITPDRIGIHYEDLYISTEDGIQLHGWKLFSEIDPVGTILYFHGNAENISTHFTNVYWLTKFGYDIYLFDYRGYGQSEGEPDLDLIIKDNELMIGHVAELEDVEEVIVIGQSLGASISIYSVAHSKHKKHIKALIAISAFSDYHDVAQDALAKSWLFWLFQWPLSFTISNKYSPVKSVGDISPIPLVLMHSKDDEIIEMYHAETLMSAAKMPKELIILEGTHNRIFSYDDNKKALLESLKSLHNTRQ